MTRINYSANAGTHNTKAKVVVAVVRQIATSLAICVTVSNRRFVSVVVPTTTAVDCEFVKQTRQLCATAHNVRLEPYKVRTL